MITSLHIKNFKSHEDTLLNLSNINILTGLNGMGKSSAIQSILLLRQSYLKSILSIGLELNGDLCSIGVAEDAIYLSAATDLIEFDLKQKNEYNIKLIFEVNRNKLSDTFLKIVSYSASNPKGVDFTVFGSAAPSAITRWVAKHDSSMFNNNFQYISAFRNGPVLLYEKDTVVVEIFNQISKREGRCEMVAHYLDYFRNAKVSDNSLTKVKDGAPELLIQVKEWLEEISPGINIHVEQYGPGYKINYSYSRGAGNTPTDKFKATNIGFGVSYALPIIVAALHVPKDGIVLVENPESHIHPAGQAKLMELICKSAKAGVQFIIETHSDHIINGLLVATKKGIVDPEESRVYFFDRNVNTHATQVTDLTVLPGGKIKKPPKGFFDQIDKDMTTLMGF